MSIYVGSGADDVTLAPGIRPDITFSEYLELIGKSGDKIDLESLVTKYRSNDNTLLTYDYLKNDSADYFFDGVYPANAAKNKWSIRAVLNNIKYDTGVSNVMLLPGTFPGFHNILYSEEGGSTDKTIKITRTATSLTIGDKTFNVNSMNDDKTDWLFIDGVIPLRLLVVLQAAGGGGGSSQDTGAGGGGGAGGCCVFVLDLIKYNNATITLGKYGTGGKEGACGTSANASKLSNSSGNVVLSVSGGEYGKEGNGVYGGDGGIGGAVSGLSAYHVKTITGGRGGHGKRGNGNHTGWSNEVGEHCSLGDIYLDSDGTANEFLLFNELLNNQEYLGGDSPGEAGGGGASAFGTGGSGGYTGSGAANRKGKAGGLGAGGGGGTYLTATYNSGGDGGPAAVLIMY